MPQKSCLFIAEGKSWAYYTLNLGNDELSLISIFNTLFGEKQILI